jgi:hypothetical protein
MQQGSVIREHRELGPDVWCFRWWESGPNGNIVQRRIVLGTAEQMRDASSARQLTVGLVQEMSPGRTQNQWWAWVDLNHRPRPYH